jgi:hypothetical protein
MSNLADQIESVQPDVFAKLMSEPFFASVNIFLLREKTLADQINRALGGLGGPRAGSLGGATIEVLFPTLKAALADTPGPVCTLEQRFIVKEQRTINEGAGGTGLSAENLAVAIVQTFQLFFMGGPMQGFYVAPTWYREVDAGPGSPFFMVEVTLNATFALTALTRTLAPAAAAVDSGGNSTVTLTDQQLGGGSSIYYTTDGSFPGPANLPANNPAGTAALYTTPFVVPIGTVVRTAAWNGNLQGSMVDTFTVT